MIIGGIQEQTQIMMSLCEL